MINLRDEEYTRLAAEAAREGLWLRAMLAVAYNFGWRRGELLGLRVHQVDLLARTIRFEVGETKKRCQPSGQDAGKRSAR